MPSSQLSGLALKRRRRLSDLARLDAKCLGSGPPLEHDEENRKVAVMQTGGPSCPLHLGTLDSPDYWTDDALMAAVRPLSATELHRMALGMQQRQERRDQFDPARS